MKKVAYVMLLALTMLTIVQLNACAQDVEIIMDTWEITQPQDDMLEKVSGEATSIILGMSQEERTNVPWDGDENICIWVSGWLIPRDGYVYYVHEMSLDNDENEVILSKRVAQESGIFGYESQGKVRVCFYLMTSKSRLGVEQIQEKLQQMIITASVEKTDYQTSAYIPVRIGMGEIKQRIFHDMPAITALVTINEKVDKKSIDEYNYKNIYRNAKDFIDAGSVSYWKVNGIISSEYAMQNIVFVYARDVMRLNESIDLSVKATQKKFTTEMVVPGNGNETNKDAIEVLKQSGLNCLVSFEPTMEYGNSIMGPYYMIKVDYQH